MIRAIVCVDAHWGIGRGNALLFSLPKDMKFFRETTLGKAVVMGGNTLRSFPNGKPLKNRTNLVLSRTEKGDGCAVFPNITSLKAELKKREKEEVYVIGGAKIYELLLPYCRELSVTKVSADGNADVFFPDLDKRTDFVCVDEGEPIDDNGCSIRFTKYVNKTPQEL